jgi:septal ring-binding cell division protein DamX
VAPGIVGVDAFKEAVMEELDLLAAEEEEEAEEGASRPFMTMVAVLGGLLVIGICIFVVFTLVVLPNMTGDIEATNAAIEATNAARLAAATETAQAPEPTDTPELTSTPTRRPTSTPAPPTATESGDAGGETVVPTATPTRRPTATVTPGGGSVPDTGIAPLGAGVVGVGLLVLLFAVRRARRPA